MTEVDELNTERAEAAEVVRILDAHDKLIYSGKGVRAPEAIRDNSRIRVEVRELAACIAQAEAERDAALAVIEQARDLAESTSQGEHGDYGEPVVFASDLLDRLTTSPPDALDAVKADAFDEGALRVIQWNKSFPLLAPTDNPYRNPRTPGEEDR